MTALIVIAAAIVLLRILALANKPLPPSGHWHHHFENFNYSSNEFYQAIHQAVWEKQIPGTRFSRVAYAEGGTFSMSREYFRITRKRMVFDICAAPFAQGFFVSWWLTSFPSFKEVLIMLIPWLGKTALRNERAQTYFEMDTETMFKDSIQECVQKVVEAMTTAKGLRTHSVPPPPPPTIPEAVMNMV